MAKQKLGQILIEMGYVTKQEVDSAIESQQGEDKGKKIGEILVEDKACDEEQVAKAIAHQSGLKYCQISKFQIPPDVVGAVSRDAAVEHTIVPLKKGKRALIIASENAYQVFRSIGPLFMLLTKRQTGVELREMRRILKRDVRELAQKLGWAEIIKKADSHNAGLDELRSPLHVSGFPRSD